MLNVHIVLICWYVDVWQEILIGGNLKKSGKFIIIYKCCVFYAKMCKIQKHKNVTQNVHITKYHEMCNKMSRNVIFSMYWQKMLYKCMCNEMWWNVTFPMYKIIKHKNVTKSVHMTKNITKCVTKSHETSHFIILVIRFKIETHVR